MTALTWAEVESAFRALDPAVVAGERWFRGGGRPVDTVRPVEAFDLGGGTGLAVAEAGERGRPAGRYLFPLARRAGGPAAAVATEGDGAWRALAAAMAAGRTVPGLPHGDATVPSGPVTAALVCRPASGLDSLLAGGSAAVAAATERPFGGEHANTLAVIGERLLLKAYRRLEVGLNPDLELNAWLAEEVGFGGVPALAGYAEVVTARGAATVAMLQEYVADGLDGFDATAEQLAAWILAPGEVTVEFATEIASSMGELTGALHAALTAAPDAPGFEVREASRDELRAWRREGQRQLQGAVDAVARAERDGVTSADDVRGVRELASRIAEELSVFEAVASVPVVARTHGNLRLGEVLLAPDGPRVVDFEGDTRRPVDERRRPWSPMRDAASMLRSLDRAGRVARRRAELRQGGPVARPGVDLESWLRRGRARFVAAYRGGLRAGGSPVPFDADLLRAWEVERACADAADAPTRRPGPLHDSLHDSLQGLRALLDEPSP